MNSDYLALTSWANWIEAQKQRQPTGELPLLQSWSFNSDWRKLNDGTPRTTGISEQGRVPPIGDRVCKLRRRASPAVDHEPRWSRTQWTLLHLHLPLLRLSLAPSFFLGTLFLIWFIFQFYSISKQLFHRFLSCVSYRRFTKANVWAQLCVRWENIELLIEVTLQCWLLLNLTVEEALVYIFFFFLSLLYFEFVINEYKVFVNLLFFRVFGLSLVRF